MAGMARLDPPLSADVSRRLRGVVWTLAGVLMIYWPSVDTAAEQRLEISTRLNGMILRLVAALRKGLSMPPLSAVSGWRAPRARRRGSPPLPRRPPAPPTRR